MEKYNNKETVRFNGPAYAQMLAQKNVLDKKVTSTSSNQKVRTFAYASEDNNTLKVIVINKQSVDSVNITINLPMAYQKVNAMVLRGERDETSGSASEWETPIYEEHLNGDIAVNSTVFTDTIDCGECAVVYTFFNMASGSLGTFDLTSPLSNENVGTAHNFTWSDCENASNYRLIVSENSDLSAPVIDVYTSGETNYQPSEDLSYNKTYYCKIIASSGASSVDNSSGIVQFSTLPSRVFVNDTVLQDEGNGYWTYSSGWYAQNYLGCFQGNDHASCTANSTATFTFSGTQARIYGIKGHWCGMIEVTVDNGIAEAFDLYREAPIAQASALPTQDMIFDTGSLSNGQHTVTIRVLNESNTAVAGTRIGILYEASPDGTWLTGLQGIYYNEFLLSELLQTSS